MEEVKCCLLGLDSGLLTCSTSTSDPSFLDAAGATPSPAGPSQEPTCSPAPHFFASFFHPSECQLLEQLLPLGRSYRALSTAARDAAIGRVEGLYPSAISTGLKKILSVYAEAVAVANTPAALTFLPTLYAHPFSMLERIVLVQRQVERCLPLLQTFLQHQEVAPLFRCYLGESMWLAVLYATAHYVAHGVVLHGRDDYFISLRVKPSTSPRKLGSSANGEEHTLYTDRLPPGISADLGLLILTAGRERRILLRDTDVQGGGDYLEQLALGSQDEAANAVFHSIFSLQLCQGGVLAVEELTARVEAAKALWSRALWMKVGDIATLRLNLQALRDMFLCHRGDVWYTVVERLLPALVVRSSKIHATASEGRGGQSNYSSAATLSSRDSHGAAVALQRAASESLSFALSVCSVAEKIAYQSFGMRMSTDFFHSSVGSARDDGTDRKDAQSGDSVEDQARRVVEAVRGLCLQYTPPSGLSLIVSSKAQQYYQQLFSFHLCLRFSLEALAVSRGLFTEAMMTNASPSQDLRRAFALFQLLNFMETTLGYYLQVDVIAVYSTRLEEQLASCTSVEDAKRLHDQFMWSTAEATFLTEGSEALLHACHCLFASSMTLYTMCMRYRLPYWAVSGVNETPVEVRATLSALELRVQQEVVAVFTGYLGLGRRLNERALWSRLDFNKYFSVQQRRGTPLSQKRTGREDVQAMFPQPRAVPSPRAQRSSSSHIASGVSPRLARSPNSRRRGSSKGPSAS